MQWSKWMQVRWRGRLLAIFTFLVAGGLASYTADGAEVCNIKVVTDGSPDYTDIGSMIHSITDNWPQTKDKCWAL